MSISAGDGAPRLHLVPPLPSESTSVESASTQPMFAHAPTLAPEDTAAARGLDVADLWSAVEQAGGASLIPTDVIPTKPGSAT